MCNYNRSVTTVSVRDKYEEMAEALGRWKNKLASIKVDYEKFEKDYRDYYEGKVYFGKEVV